MKTLTEGPIYLSGDTKVVDSDNLSAEKMSRYKGNKVIIFMS